MRTSRFASVLVVCTSLVRVAHADEPLPELPPEQPAPAESPRAYPAPTADRPAAPASIAADAKKFRTSFKGELGYEYAQLDGVPIMGERGMLGFGGQNDQFGHYVTLSVLWGKTEDHLRTWDFRVGWHGDLLRVGILRFGLGGDIGYVVVHRATLDSHLYALGVGALAHAGIDVVQWGERSDHAITIDARFEADVHLGWAFMWSPSLLAGVRY